MKKFLSYLLAIPVFFITLSGFGNLVYAEYQFDIYLGLASLFIGFIGIFLLYKYGEF